MNPDTTDNLHISL